MTIYELAKIFKDISLDYYFSILMEKEKICVKIRVGSAYGYDQVTTSSWENDKELDERFNEIIEELKSLFHYTCVYDYEHEGRKGTGYSDAIKGLNSIMRNLP